MRRVLLVMSTLAVFLTIASNSPSQRRRHGAVIASQVTTAEQADQQMRSFWARKVARCGDSYYTQSRFGNITEFKGFFTSLDPPWALSEADRLNGYEYKTFIRADARLSRYFNLSEKTWSNWRDKGFPETGPASNLIMKFQGKWIVEDEDRSISSFLSTINCSELPWVSGRYGVELDKYCSRTYDSQARAIHSGSNPYSWSCRTGSNVEIQIDMNHACQFQHGRTFEAALDKSKGFDGWYCRQTPRANANDLSDTYGYLNTYIFNKKTKVIFTTPEQFFADSGRTSFVGLKYDMVTHLPPSLRFADGRPLTTADIVRIEGR